MAKRKGKGKAGRRIKDWNERLMAGESPDDIAHRGQKPGLRAVKLLEGQVCYCVVAKTFRAQPHVSALAVMSSAILDLPHTSSRTKSAFCPKSSHSDAAQ